MSLLLVINLGSTSTKIALYDNDQCRIYEDIPLGQVPEHAVQDMFEQYAWRMGQIEQFLDEAGVALADVDAVVSRGGLTQALEAGAYRICEHMLEQAESGDYGMHPCNLGLRIAFDLAQKVQAVPITVDTPVVCEMIPEALYSGLPGVWRKPASQPLNSRMMARTYAEDMGRPYEELRLIVVNLGGGVTVAAHVDGCIIDTQDGAAGDGPFCNNRCNGVPVRALVDMCYSGQYTYDEMLDLLYAQSGLKGYLGEVNVRAIEDEINQGSALHREVLSAMCYQIAKEVGGLATVLEGKVDAVILTGNLGKSPFVSSYLERACSFIAPVVHMPGQREMDALAYGASQALAGTAPLKDFETQQVDIESLVLAGSASAQFDQSNQAVPEVPAGHPEKPEGEDGFKLVARMNGGHHEELSLWGLSYLTINDGDNALDIGCGGGANLARLLERTPTGTVTGVDFSPVSLQASREFNADAIARGQCAILEGNASELPLDDNTMDIVTAFETVYYWDIPTAFAEVKRVLKPSGQFLICNEDDGLDEGMHEFAKKVPTMTIYTIDELTAFLTEAGFSIESAVDIPETGHLAIVGRAD